MYIATFLSLVYSLIEKVVILQKTKEVLWVKI